MPRKRARKKKKTRKLEADDRHVNALEGMQRKRISDVGRWVDIKTKDYYFDTRGDRDNLIFGSLYRMDVARFYRCHTEFRTREYEKGLRHIFGSEDDVTVDEKERLEGRYWSAKYAALERRKDFRRVQIVMHPSKSKGKKPFLAPGDFIAVDDTDIQQEEDGQHIVREESWDDYVIRKTREFNQSTRERPHDESLWIAFANFQDELIKQASRKAAIQQAVEKKVAVLEKALEHHPFSEDLLLLFLETCRKKDTATTLVSKWENAIKHNLGSYKLWREYLHFRRGEFSLFTVSSLQKLYIHALQSFSTAHNRRHWEGGTGEKTRIVQGNETETEKSLLSLFVDLCRFEWQTGHHELAIGLCQAQVEYNIFSPPIKVKESNKRRLFQEFWDSGAPRVGEDGAAGWAAWLQQEEERMQSIITRSADPEEVTTGGWTGWSEPSSKDVMSEDEPPPLDADVTVDDENADLEKAEDDKDEAVLLERLGLTLESGQEIEVKDVLTWKRWSEEEQKRDTSQWLPIRTNSRTVDDDEILPEPDDDNQPLERAVLFEDIRECLFSFDTAEARFELMAQFIDFCDGPYPQWCCTNSMRWKERVETLENVFGSFLQELQNACLHVGHLHQDDILQKLVGGMEWIHESEGRISFLSNMLLLVRPFFPQSFWLQEKLLAIESHKSALGARGLAKRILKTDRQAVLLWGAYACVEAANGNLEVARKVFDTTLASLSSLPEETQEYAPILYLAYADVELSQLSKARDSEVVLVQQKVLHILSCLGCQAPYTCIGVDSLLSSIQILKAKCGFREQLQNLRKGRIQGDISDKSTALIACAALFELLVDGFEAAGSVFEESLAMSLPVKRQYSLQFELLYVRYVNMLEQHKQSLKPRNLRHAISCGLTQYPSNPQLLGAFIRCSSRSTCMNGLRRFFDDMVQRNPSTVVWLFAISIEIRKVGSGPRIHSLFERALETSDTQQSVVLWRCYLAYELEITHNIDAARRVFFRAIHACPWDKALWLDGFQKMSSVLTAKELSELQDIMREKELRLRTDVYEILLEDENVESPSDHS